jgi:hypothetical protein
MPLIRGEDGRMHFEAAAPGQVAAQTVTGAIVPRQVAGGNPNFDPSSGRFSGPNDQNTNPADTTPINRDAIQGVAGLAPVVNQYIALVTQRFADAASMAVYPQDDSSTVVLFDANGARLTAFPVPNAQATPDQIDKFSQEVAQPLFDKAAQERIDSLTRTGTPEGIDPDDWAHHQDTIRDAARTLPEIDLATANQFLADHNAADVPAEQFIKDVREQQIDDLADVLSQQLQGKIEQIKRARQSVRVTAPSGWTKRVFAGLKDDEVVKLLTRLEGKGWDPEDIKKHIVDRIKDPERAAKIQQLFGQKKQKSGKKTPKARVVAAEDPFEAQPESVLMELQEPREPEQPQINLAEEMTKLAAAMPQPVHNVYVTLPEQKPMKRTPIRDENNVITAVIEEPADA